MVSFRSFVFFLFVESLKVTNLAHRVDGGGNVDASVGKRRGGLHDRQDRRSRTYHAGKRNKSGLKRQEAICGWLGGWVSSMNRPVRATNDSTHSFSCSIKYSNNSWRIPVASQSDVMATHENGLHLFINKKKEAGGKGLSVISLMEPRRTSRQQRCA